MGYLAPTISILKDKLSTKLDIPAMKPLIELLSGIDDRFGSILNDERIIAAAVVHPKFKDNWTSERDIIEESTYWL